METSKITFIEFVEKFFPEEYEGMSEFHKQFTKKISDEIAKNPGKRLVIYYGRPYIGKSIINEYLKSKWKEKS